MSLCANYHTFQTRQKYLFVSTTAFCVLLYYISTINFMSWILGIKDEYTTKKHYSKSEKKQKTNKNDKCKLLHVHRLFYYSFLWQVYIALLDYKCSFCERSAYTAKGCELPNQVHLGKYVEFFHGRSKVIFWRMLILFYCLIRLVLLLAKDP